MLTFAFFFLKKKKERVTAKEIHKINPFISLGMAAAAVTYFPRWLVFGDFVFAGGRRGGKKIHPSWDCVCSLLLLETRQAAFGKATVQGLDCTTPTLPPLWAVVANEALTVC